MSRPGAMKGLAAAALLVVPLGMAADAGAAKPVPDYTITVDDRAQGAVIDDTMYGVFFEDINYAADGGLYAELVRNRSFEFNSTDASGFNGMTAWQVVNGGGAAPTAQVVNDATRLNENNRNHLRLTSDGPGDGVRNIGYNTGFALKAGATYDASVWARTTTAQTVTFALTDANGSVTYASGTVAVDGSDAWKQYKLTLTSDATVTDARLAVTGGAASVMGLDMVSLMPRDRWVGKNGLSTLRKDLAQKIADLNPGFVRFPGGCIVNVNSHRAYTAANNFPRARSYQWKETVGPVEQRPTNANFWGYNQSYGLGYYEYFTFAEDIGAMPLPVVPAVLNGCGQSFRANEQNELQRHIQDTLDLIEFANGPVTSTWGKLRADMGHPAPFNLTHVGVGNEENFPAQFITNFVQFRDAIKAKYPNITVISNSGPDDEGTTFEQHWAQNRANDVEMVDEHYYNSPTWFLQNNDRYDSYDRNGPKVFLGEYASQDAKLFNSLSEAAFMTGLERNADIVKLASYAPLLANVDNVQWRPDMIWFDNHQSWGSTSYEVQKLFMNNVGDRVIPSTASGKVMQPTPITGAVGLSTWRTAAKYDDVKVTAPDGTTLFTDDFNDGNADGWRPLANRGTWGVTDGQFVQTSTTAEDTLVAGPALTATDYDVTLKATKTAGAEGFLVGFGVKDSGNFYWWNLGGWNNTRSVVEKATSGAKQTLVAREGHSITTNKAYDVKISVRGTKVTLSLDGQEFFSFDDNTVVEPFAQVVTHDDATGDTIVKVVNAQNTPAVTKIDLGKLKVAKKATMTVISGDPGQQNTRSAQPIRPVTTQIDVPSQFYRTFDANSVTFIRIPKK
ncbi:alpha-L-arabinofuranosidase C-terminal domain-containing protein [Motilibacter aurantiacus]|uniref:alpha-L-arabinofuranosidase C-terminal domain-containing protein n=1 Tax=Motilibacter aurantiacus TaxID=2714955 RepID=UPI0014084C8C|nr:alpha-L-arabinofuranosidase C-terminal domain-containing protein [Motilibacter aurantiacus]NHC47458.1 alpha-N-arabinofuranosidase [Motilibacter aurantiacus]